MLALEGIFYIWKSDNIYFAIRRFLGLLVRAAQYSVLDQIGPRTGGPAHFGPILSPGLSVSWSSVRFWSGLGSVG